MEEKNTAPIGVKLPDATPVAQPSGGEIFGVAVPGSTTPSRISLTQIKEHINKEQNEQLSQHGEKLTELEVLGNKTTYTRGYIDVDGGILKRDESCPTIVSDFIPVDLKNNTLVYAAGCDNKKLTCTMSFYDSRKVIIGRDYENFTERRIFDQLPERLIGSKYVRATFFIGWNSKTGSLEYTDGTVLFVAPFSHGNQDNIDAQTEYKKGYLNEAGDIVPDESFVVTPFIPFDRSRGVKYYSGCLRGKKEINICFYDWNFNKLGNGWGNATDVEPRNLNEGVLIQIDFRPVFFRASFYVGQDQTATKVEYLDDGSIIFELPVSRNVVNKNKKDIFDLQGIKATFSKGFITDNGAIQEENIYSPYIVSSYISFDVKRPILYYAGCTAERRSIDIAFYDKDFNRIHNCWFNKTNPRDLSNISIDERYKTAKYIRVSFYTGPDADGAKVVYSDNGEILCQAPVTFSDIQSLKDNEVLPTEYPQEVGYRRSEQMVNLKYTPIADIPWAGGEKVHAAGVERTGMLYGEGAYQDRRVAFDVSLHTFMTALHNPYSLLYTENTNDQHSKSAYGIRYHGDVLSGAWMGHVCNNFVHFAIGCPIPYTSTEIYNRAMSGKEDFEKVYDQSIHGLKLMDVLTKKGHAQLVTRLFKNDRGVITGVQISEQGQSGAKNNSIRNQEQLDKWMKDWGYIICRYKNLYKNIDYQPSEFVAVEEETLQPYKYNDDICTFAGDKVPFLEGAVICINYNKGVYTKMEIYKDDILLETIDLPSSADNHSINITEKNYKYGMYKARLTDGQSAASDYTFFEIVNAELRKEGNTAYISSANATPLYWSYVNIQGTTDDSHLITEEEKEKGQIDVSATVPEHNFLKVHFVSKYGRVARVDDPNYYL